MKTKTRVKTNCLLAVACIILGISGLIFGRIKQTQHSQTEILMVGGVLLIAMGFVRLVRYLSALKNKAKMEQIEIERNDERVKLLAYKSGYVAFIISVLGIYFYSMYLLAIDSPLFESISTVCSILLCIYLVCYVVIKKIN